MQTTLNTHALTTKNCYDLLSESGHDDCSKSVSTFVKLVKQRPKKDLNRAKKPPKTKVIISDSMLKRLSGAKLSRDIEKKNG